MAKGKRGISLGTLTVLSLLAVCLVMGVTIFARFTAGIRDVKLDPQLLLSPVSGLLGGPTATPQTTQAPALATAPPLMATAAQPTPTAQTRLSFTLSAGGRVWLGKELREAGKQGFGEMFAPLSAFLSGSDLSFVTLYTQLGTTGFDNTLAPGELANALQSTGFTVANMATDRALDKGLAAIHETRGILEAVRLSPAGVYRTLEERAKLTVMTVNGIKIGILPFTQTLSTAGKKNAQQDQDIGVRLYDASRAAQDVRTLKEQGAEVIIVLCSWGAVGDNQPSRQTKEAAATLIAAGADIILGTGPAKVHTFERLQTADGRTGWVCYSLGNLLMEDSRDTGEITGMLLKLAFTWDTQTKTLSLTNGTFLPTWIMRWRDVYNVARFRVVPAGATKVPADMTDTIYVNMKKAYQGIVSLMVNTGLTPVTD